MTARILTFANTLLAALLVGAMFGTWLRGNTVDLSPNAYVQQQQHGIRLNGTMPVLGAVVALLTLAAAILAWRNRRRCRLFIVAMGCFVVAGAVTRFLNQPINAIVMTWSPDAPPENWAELRDSWWRWHVLRTAFGLGGLALLIATGLVADVRAADSVAPSRAVPQPSAA